MKRALWYVALGMVVLVLAGGCRWMNVSLTVLQTSDLHHHASGYGPFLDYTPLDVSDSDTVTGGYARLATLIRGIRAEQEARCIPTLVVDSGDFFMGTAYDLNVHDPLALKFFELVGYDAVTLGNHEFDWSPGGLALLLANGATQGFGVPVVATNTVIPAGNALEACREAGIIVDRHIVEYPHGIKVGILGIMGMDADSKAPAAGEVTFEHGWPFIQAQVDELRNTEKVELVMVLSHGGINSDGTGDDAELTANVTGIDIIASGHYHTATGKAFVSGPSNTIVFSPGEYGEYLSRLDLTYNVLLRKVVNYRFSLIPVDDTVPGDPEIQALVEEQHSVIDGLIAAFGVNLDSPVSSTGFVLETTAFLESSLGNLAADAVRFAAGVFAPLNNGDPCDFSVVASGVIRDSLTPGATGQITFADVYNVLPLGISPDPSQATGYPLMSVYVRAADLRNICEAALSLARIIGSDYYLNFSGIEVQYDPLQAGTLRGVTGVSLFEPGDFFCTGGGRAPGSRRSGCALPLRGRSLCPADDGCRDRGRAIDHPPRCLGRSHPAGPVPGSPDRYEPGPGYPGAQGVDGPAVLPAGEFPGCNPRQPLRRRRRGHGENRGPELTLAPRGERALPMPMRGQGASVSSKAVHPRGPERRDSRRRRSGAAREERLVRGDG